MALVSIEQTDLDNIATSLEALATTVSGLPTGVLPAADETALNQAVTDVQTAVAAVVTADTPPAPSP